MPQLYTNNASARLVEDLQPGDTVINLAPGEGDRFPLPDAGVATSYALITLEDTSGYFEIAKLTGRSGDILTVERGQENTAAAGFAIGSRCECRLTAGSLNNFVQQEEKGDLRLGDPIDVDGIRYWHVDDPSRYQYFEIKYHTNILGMQVLVTSSPPSLPGTSWGASIVGPGGVNQYVWLSADLTVNALRPATGETCLSAPGVLSLENIDNAFTPRLFISYANALDAAPGPGDWMRIHSAGTRRMQYSFTTRDSEGNEDYIGFLENGALTASTFLGIRNKDLAKYPDADQLIIDFLPNAFAPAVADVAIFDRNTVTPRQLDYVFVTVEVSEDAPPEAIRKNVVMTKGKVQSGEEPTQPDDLCNKTYVDAVAAGIVDIAGGVEVFKETLFAGDVAADTGTLTVADPAGVPFSAVAALQILVWGDNDGGGFLTLSLNVEDMITDLGFGNRFVIYGDDKRTVFFTALSDTTFELTKDGGGPTFYIRKIIGRGAAVGTLPQPVYERTRFMPHATNRIARLE